MTYTTRAKLDAELEAEKVQLDQVVQDADTPALTERQRDYLDRLADRLVVWQLSTDVVDQNRLRETAIFLARYPVSDGPGWEFRARLATLRQVMDVTARMWTLSSYRLTRKTTKTDFNRWLTSVENVTNQLLVHSPKTARLVKAAQAEFSGSRSREFGTWLKTKRVDLFDELFSIFWLKRPDLW